MNCKIALVAVAFVLLGGCRTAPIHNISEASVVVAAGKQATADNVKTSILRAGAGLGWEMSEAGPGAILAKISLRTHMASADIKYTTKTYSITYRDSNNLDADGSQIHKNYNGWIENLDRAIRAELLRP
jgi:hypothetical protein